MSTPPRHSPSWFNARSITAFLIGLMTVGVVWSVVAQWIPPNPRVPAFNTYSGTVIGYRAIYELLRELGTPVTRAIAPPPLWLKGHRRILLLQPSILALELEKDYLRRLQEWVRAGGELVVVSDELGPDAVWESLPDRDEERAERMMEFYGDDLLLAGFGVDDLEVVREEYALDYLRDESDDWRHVVTNLYADYRRLDTAYEVTATGSLTPTAAQNGTIKLPGETLRYFEGSAVANARGTISVTGGGAGSAKPIALEYGAGEGSLLLVAEPALLTNASLDIDANAVLAYRLAAGSNGLPVLIDEYYHGSLSGRSALHVLTFSPFPTVALMILLAVVLWAWSQLVRFGPPQVPEGANRRNMLEYVDAMARLYRRGRKESFMLKNLRDGALDRLRRELHLPHGISETLLLHRLHQRNHDAAVELASVLHAIDGVLSSNSPVSQRQLHDLQGKLEQCIWTNIPAPAIPTPSALPTTAPVRPTR